jgi:hypothetical protein
MKVLLNLLQNIGINFPGSDRKPASNSAPKFKDSKDSTDKFRRTPEPLRSLDKEIAQSKEDGDANREWLALLDQEIKDAKAKSRVAPTIDPPVPDPLASTDPSIHDPDPNPNNNPWTLEPKGYKGAAAREPAYLDPRTGRERAN